MQYAKSYVNKCFAGVRLIHSLQSGKREGWGEEEEIKTATLI